MDGRVERRETGSVLGRELERGKKSVRKERKKGEELGREGGSVLEGKRGVLCCVFENL